MPNEFIIKNGLVVQSGTTTITGSLQVTGGITGSLLGTASYATQALTASYVSTYAPVFPFTGSAVITGSLQVTGGITGSVQGTASNAISSSYALTASFALNGGGNSFPFTGSAQITGSLGVTGSITATSFNGDGSGLTNVVSTNVASNLFNYYNFI